MPPATRRSRSSPFSTRNSSDAAEKLHQIRCMPRPALSRPPGDVRKVSRYGQQWDFHPVHTYVLAFQSSDLSDLADHLREVERAWVRWECLDAVYALDKGYLLDAAGFGNSRQQFHRVLAHNALLVMVLELLTHLPSGRDPIFNSAAYLGQVPLGMAMRGFGQWNQDGSQV